MTCIVGIAHDGKVTMGADSAAASGWDMRPTSLSKVFHLGPLLIGYTASFRMGQLLQYKLELAQYGPVRGDGTKWMVTKFIPAVRKCLAKGGYTKIKDNKETGGLFLVGYHGDLYSVESDFQVNTFQDGIAAIGCGRSYALAVLHVLRSSPRKRIARALDTAAYFSNGVLPPFFILSSEEK